MTLNITGGAPVEKSGRLLTVSHEYAYSLGMASRRRRYSTNNNNLALALILVFGGLLILATIVVNLLDLIKGLVN